MKKIISWGLVVLCLFSALPVFGQEVTDTDIAGLMYKLEILEGDGNGNLRLSDGVTRAEFTKMTVNASPYRNTVAKNLSVSPFSDVPYTHWAAPYVLVAKINKMVSGYPDATFRPDSGVKLEEALNILLKLLGYTDTDFGLSYPYGQISLADHLDILDGIEASAGSELTRGECMKIIYNTLSVMPKGANVSYINAVGYTLAEDTVITATNATDSGVSAGYVATDRGTYKMTDDFDSLWIGRRGIALIKNNEELLYFCPDTQIVEQHTVYQVLGDKLVTMMGTAMAELSPSNSMRVYYKAQPTTFAEVRGGIQTGDVWTLYKNEMGEIEYATLNTDDYKGPITATGGGTLATLGLESPSVIRNGIRTGAESVAPGDILYYSKSLNTVWCYNQTVTGVYNSASPNQDMPKEISLSGKTYAIENMEAFRKLASGGEFRVGDTVTLLLGKEGAVADAIVPGSVPGASQGGHTTMVSGYLYRTGSALFEKDNTEHSSYYADVVTASGETMRYEVNKDYSSIRNSVVEVRFSESGTTVTQEKAASGISGTFDWDALKIGKTPLASNVKILDVAKLAKNATGLYTTVPGQRLSGMDLRAGDVLYYEKNASGAVSALILNDVTGDMYQYGIISASTYSSGKTDGGATEYLSGGASMPVQSADSVYRISKGTPVQVAAGSGKVDTMKALTKLSGKVSALTATDLVANGKTYLLWDRATAYKKTTLSGGTSYTMIPISELIGNKTYSVSAYVDKNVSDGGRVRILIAE